RLHRIDHERADAIDAQLQRHIWDEPLATGERPLRVHLTETPRRTYLQTIHTHVYADATACYTLTQQLAERYAVPADTPPPLPHAAHTTPVDLLAGAARGAGSMRRRLRGLGLSARDLAAAEGGLAMPPRARPGRRVLGRLVLDEDESARLLAAARV